MNELITLTHAELAGAQVQAVDARELHAFLEVGRDFTNWIKERVEKYGFQEGQDFSPVLAKTPGEAGRPRTEYIITLDMAKELAMVENNEKGREARRYFIECERRAKGIAPAFVIPQTLPDALRLAADLAEQNRKLEGTVAEQAPKVAAHNRLMDADGSLSLRETAKALNVPERRFIQELHARGWIFKPHGARSWLGYSDKTKAGLLIHKLTPVIRDDGSEKICEQVRVTARGATKLAEMLHTIAA